ncbi:MAG TPA: GNAT family N-acetyltransferase, partial [Pilimelia sp.]|nr:GNAT family N-acetyltransferase [Pilimelia sp.]
MADSRLLHHLASWLGQWPAGEPLQVVGSARRVEPGWDGGLHPAIGVGCGDSTVLSVPPPRTATVRDLVARDPGGLLARLPGAVGFDEWTAYRAVFRWTVAPAPLPDAGEWTPSDDPTLPGWLRAFPGEVLVARDPATGAYWAGVGLKRHDGYGTELAVGTDPAARGRGLARRLVAQAARRVLDEGAVATYQHDIDNVASARVADAAGLPDRGWTSIGLAAPIA